MKEHYQKLAKHGLKVPEILMPQNADLQKWAVIACDQFTQDRDYWEGVKNAAGQSPSTLNLIIPEVFLADGDEKQRIAAIHENMKSYLDGGVFAAPRQGVVYIERDTRINKKRRGLVVALDLEQYEWKPEARPLIRSTEGTVVERLPPRMDIRRGAPLESPHVLLLIDDETDSLLAELGERAKKNKAFYETKLMMDSGSIAGWLLESDEDLAFFAERLDQLARRSVTRYYDGGKEGAPFLLAVGDGNHSLAAAKGIWEEYKAANSGKADFNAEHSCRYALVEIENIYDKAIQFEPIHRVIFGLNLDATVAILSKLPGFSSRPVKEWQELMRLCGEPFNGNRFGLVCGNSYLLVETSDTDISTASLQPLLDESVEAAAIDYIHGEEEVLRLASKKDSPATGIILPPFNKAGLFETIAHIGPLPRKSFSMGIASEKRFYMECRRLF
ncbi:MAG: DUF1015 domain-containing protein [Spirochaetes bacterium]|nr:DUF1015 domain-containing protein [Spirochaetota bacterium]